MTSRSASAGRGRDATAPARCANCGARITPADEWCTLCHAPVHGTPEQNAPEQNAPEQSTPEQGAGDVPAQRLASPSDAAEPEPEPETGPEPGAELTAERIDQLLARLAADESTGTPSARLGALAGLHDRAGGLLLAAVAGLILLAGGMLAMYVLGSLV